MWLVQAACGGMPDSGPHRLVRAKALPTEVTVATALHVAGVIRKCALLQPSRGQARQLVLQEELGIAPLGHREGLAMAIADLAAFDQQRHPPSGYSATLNSRPEPPR